MNSNKFFFLVAAVVFSGLLCAFSAMADVAPPKEYKSLTALEDLSPGKAPKYNRGLYELASQEARYKERLPMQLNGAMDKLSRARYKPSRN